MKRPTTRLREELSALRREHESLKSHLESQGAHISVLDGRIRRLRRALGLGFGETSNEELNEILREEP